MMTIDDTSKTIICYHHIKRLKFFKFIDNIDIYTQHICDNTLSDAINSFGTEVYQLVPGLLLLPDLLLYESCLMPH